MQTTVPGIKAQLSPFRVLDLDICVR